MPDTARLDEFDKEEWWEVMSAAVKSRGGTMSREEFEAHWAEFAAMKQAKALN